MKQEYLIHYGVKGMRWGVRKDRRAARQQAKISKFEQKSRRGDISNRVSFNKVVVKKSNSKDLKKKYDDFKSSKSRYLDAGTALTQKYEDTDREPTKSELARIDKTYNDFMKKQKVLSSSVKKVYQSMDVDQKYSVMKDIKKEEIKGGAIAVSVMAMGLSAAAMPVVAPILVKKAFTK